MMPPDQRGLDECWPWKRSTKNNGYGQFTIRKGWTVTSSRAAFVLATGPLKDGEVACHTCDNPPCCNPAHLFKGTQVDNAVDCFAKGRGNRRTGERPRARRDVA